MAVTHSYLLVALLLSAALAAPHLSAAAPDNAATDNAGAVDVTVLPFQQSPLHSKPPLEWSVQEVEYWMNNTIGYAEYAGYIRSNLIDGVTLLEMEPADFESYLPIENALHVVKIGAHVKLLKGMCKCSEGSLSGDTAGRAVDFWSYMKEHSVRTWGWGTVVLFFPRWAMAGVYMLDHDLYLDVVGKHTPTTTLKELETTGDKDLLRKAAKVGQRVADTTKAGIYWASFVVAPDLYMAYHAARLTPRNFFLMPCVVAHFLAQAFSECSLLITIYRGTAFKAGTPLLQRIWNIFSYTLFAPILGIVAGYAFPVFLQYITVAVIIAHSFLMILGIIILVVRDGLAAATTGPEDPAFHPPDQEATEDKKTEDESPEKQSSKVDKTD